MTLSNIRALPINERIKLVEDIWDSIAEDRSALQLTDAQKAELDRRLDAYESDKVKGREIEEVVTEVRKRL